MTPPRSWYRLAKLKRIPKSEIIFLARDWKGRDVVLLRSTLKQHVARFHFDEVLVLDALKSQFDRPDIVIENAGAGSEMAIYSIPSGGHQRLLVAIKYSRWMPRWLRSLNLIVTLYGIDGGYMPQGRVLWER